MSGGAVQAEILDRRAALGEELAAIEAVIALLEKASVVGRLEGLPLPNGPAGDGHHRELGAIADGLAVLRTRVRESRDRLDAWADRLRDIRDPLAENLEQVRGVLECMIRESPSDRSTAGSGSHRHRGCRQAREPARTRNRARSTLGSSALTERLSELSAPPVPPGTHFAWREEPGDGSRGPEAAAAARPALPAAPPVG